MITHYLQTTNEILSNIIEITQQDIQDIKQARHESIFERTQLKEELISSFEYNKSLLDAEITKKVSTNSNISLEDVLTQEQQEMLDVLKNSLIELQKLNKYFATMVIAVSEFYNSLLNKIVPSEQIGYDPYRAKRASYLHIKG